MEHPIGLLDRYESAHVALHRVDRPQHGQVNRAAQRPQQQVHDAQPRSGRGSCRRFGHRSGRLSLAHQNPVIPILGDESRAISNWATRLVPAKFFSSQD
jgi:hypothetical protein